MDELRLVEHHRPSEADHPPQGKRRLRLRVEYDGTDYCGWQRQSNGPSVQQTLEEAFEQLTGERTWVVGSSRTDAGVHARGLCAHVDTASRIPPEKMSLALNTRLPWDIRVLSCEEAPEGFHARYSACGKIYSYTYCNQRNMCAIGRQYAAHCPLPMDLERMREAAAVLEGRHDFRAFAASGFTASTTVRTLFRVRVTREGNLVGLHFFGDGFLYNMVRILSGTLAEIGTGKRDAGCLSRALESGDRLELGKTAPACALVLEHVLYRGDEPLAQAYFKGR